MAGPKGNEKGLREPIQLRAGIDLPYWQGLNLDKDPGAIQEAELQEAVNVRLNAGRIDNRGGQEKLTTVTLDGCVWSVDDLPMPGAGIFLSHDNGAFQLDRYNPDFNPAYAGILVNPPAIVGSHRQYGDPIAPRQTLFVWQNKLLALNNGSYPTTAAQVLQVVFPAEEDVDGVVTTKLLFELPEACSPTLVNEGGVDVLYIGTTTLNTVYRYDGTFLSNDGSISTTNQRQIVVEFHDRLFICGTQYAFIRNPGAPTINGTPGTGNEASYITVPFTASTTTFEPSAMCEFGNELIIAGRDSTIIPFPGIPGPGCLLKWDGSTMTLAHQPMNNQITPAPALGVSDCVLWNGKVWFLWMNFSASSHTYVGNYDGTTWTSIAGDLGITEAQKVCGDLLVANGLLYATLYHNDSGGNEIMVLMSSPDGAVWTTVATIDSTSDPANMALYSA